MTARSRPDRAVPAADASGGGPPNAVLPNVELAAPELAAPELADLEPADPERPAPDTAEGDDFGAMFLGHSGDRDGLLMPIHSDIERARLWPG